MVKSKLTRSGSRLSGDYYQGLVTMWLFTNWLEKPSLYDWMKVEAIEGKHIDDVIAHRSDGNTEFRQIKYATDSNDGWDLKDLLHQETTKSKSLLQKWFTSFQSLSSADGIGWIGMLTNRTFNDEIQDALDAEGHLHLPSLTQSLQDEIIEHLANVGDREDLERFFAVFKFVPDQLELELLEDKLIERLSALGLDKAAFLKLHNALQEWTRDRHTPNRDGRITINDIRKAAGWKEARALDEDFRLPDAYIPPSESFCAQFKFSVTDQNRCRVVVGSPGIGKSSFLSWLCKQYDETNQQYIKHHYFISRTDEATYNRLDADRVSEALIQQLQQKYPPAIINYGQKSFAAANLSEYLDAAGRYFAGQGKTLVIMLDGLDHVWRDLLAADELSKLLRLIFPLPSGICLILGTQKLENGQLPPLLTKHIPNERWLDLPPLDISQVKAWLNAISPAAGQEAEHSRDEIVEALFEKTKGHPLIMNYSMQYVRDSGGTLSRDVIVRVPWIPHEHVNDYYGEIIKHISESGKQVLFLLAACDCALPKDGILTSIPGSVSVANTAFKEISFLLMHGPIGYRVFHDSLSVFLHSHVDYSVYEPHLLRGVVHWLEHSAPEFYRWGWQARFEERLGNPDRIIMEVNREWFINSIVTRYPAKITERIGRHSSQTSYAHGVWEKSLLVATLVLYYDYPTDKEYDARQQLLLPQLLLNAGKSGSEYVMDDVESELRISSEKELCTVAKYGRYQGNTTLIGRCLRILTSRKYPIPKNDDYNSRDWTTDWMPLLKCLSFIGERGFQSLKSGLGVLGSRGSEGADTVAISIYAESLISIGDMQTIEALAIDSNDFEAYKPILQRALLKLCLLSRSKLHEAVISTTITDAPYRIIYDYLNHNTLIHYAETEFPNSASLTERWFGYHQRQLHRFYVESFWTIVANCLIDKVDANDKWLDGCRTDNWRYSFLRVLAECASIYAEKLQMGVPFSLEEICVLYGKLAKPDPYDSRDEWQCFQTGKDVILEISLYIFSIQDHVIKEATLSIGSEVVQQSAYFDIWRLIKLLNDCQVIKVDDHVVRTIIAKAGSVGALLVEQAPDLVDKYSSLSEFALSHKLIDDGRRYLECAARCSLGYGWHKDMSLDIALKIIRAAYALDKAQATTWLKNITPAILEIREFTDGDETRYFVGDTLKLIAEQIPDFIYSCYLYLQKKEEYHNAEAALHALLEYGDFRSAEIRAIAATAHDDKSILIIADRAKTSAEAREILNTIQALHGEAIVKESELKMTGEMSSIDREDGSALNVKLYPPAEFGEFMKERHSRSYSVWGELLMQWLGYWEAVEPDGALDAVLPEREFIHYRGGITAIMSLYIKLRGNDDYGFEYLWQTFRREALWQEFMTHDSIVREFWMLIKQHYELRWREFFEKSFGPWRDLHSTTSEIGLLNVPKVVEYFGMFAANEEALRLAKAAIETILSMVEHLPLPSPDSL